MARETLKDFLNSKGHATDSISYVQKESPDGLGVDPGTGEELVDLVNSAKGLLGDYLKFLVDNSSNDFKLKGGNEKASSSKRGDDLVLADLQGADNVFVEQGTVLKAKLNENSNSGKFDSSGTDLNTLVDKVGKNFSNHNKLKEIQGRERSVHGSTLTNANGDENDIVQATQKMFLANNRFANVGNPNKQSFTVKPQSIEQFEKDEKTNNSGTLNLQRKFGVYDQNSQGITSIEKIKQIGASLLLKSSGFSYGSTPGNTEETYEFLDGINEESAKNFDLNAGFSKLNFSNIRAKNAKGFPDNNAGTSIRSDRGEFVSLGSEGFDDNANSKTTFGSTYNTGFRFQGNTIKLHKIQAAISMIALKNVGSRFWSSFIEKLRQEDRVDLTASTESFVKENTKGDVLTYMLGKSRQLGSLQIDNFIFGSLLTNTTYPYGDAVDRGLEILFGNSDRDDPEKVAEQSIISQAPGFWLAISRSVLKSFDDIYQKYSGEDLNQGLSTKELFSIYKDMIESNRFIRFFNVLAVMGDISLSSTDGVKNNIGDKNFKRARDVDAIPDTLSIPGKSRKKDGFNKNELSWGSNTTPSMYILPANIIRAASLLNNTVEGENPARGMLGSKLSSSTYMGIDVDGSFNRIPNEVVKILEDKLDSEYVPFYIQDLRTNEIISFHAFLDSLSDTITPTFNGVSAYGRADAVQIYQSTTRSLQVGFTLFATNREDFDAMWYKINKFVTLLYPQYTPGSMVSNGEGSKFYQPFSQVVGASPIVRLRIGDVIKSNYSRFGLARAFGIGDDNVNAKLNQTPTLGSLVSSVDALSNVYNVLTDSIIKVWLSSFGSPHSVVNLASGAVPTGSSGLAKMLKSSVTSGVISAAAGILVNGFANPLAVDNIILQLTDPNQQIGGNDQTSKLLSYLDESALTTGYAAGTVEGVEAFTLRQMILKPNVVNGYFCAETGKKYLLPRRIKVRVMKKGPMSNLSEIAGLPNIIGYLVKVVDPAAPIELSNQGSEQHLVVRHSDILPDPKELFNNSVIGAALFASDPIAAAADVGLNQLMNDYTLNSGIPNEINDFIRSQYLRDDALFMRPELNPYVRAMETTKGRGLAGVIKGITFNWLDNFPWEVDYNARAPMGVKISFGFDVIHDLPPGLDHSGYNKAPLYNVGEIMRNLSGDVYEDNGKSAELNYRKEGGKASRVKGQNNG